MLRSTSSLSLNLETSISRDIDQVLFGGVDDFAVLVRMSRVSRTVSESEPRRLWVVLAGPGSYGLVPLLGFGPGLVTGLGTGLVTGLGTGLDTGLGTGLGTALGFGLVELPVDDPVSPPPAIIALFPAPPKPLKSPAIAPCNPYCLTRFQTSLSDHGCEDDDDIDGLLLPPLPNPGSLIIASAELAMDKMRRNCATVWDGRIFVQCRSTKDINWFVSRVAVKTKRREFEIWKERKEYPVPGDVKMLRGA